MKDDTTATPSRRVVFLGLAAILTLPTPAQAQQQCPAGGYHLWVVWGTDNKTGRTIQRRMKCGVLKIG